MNTTALGTWRKPPLAYVVSELILSPYYTMPAKLPALQELLRKGFPKTIEGQELVLAGQKPTTQPVWQLVSADQHFGVQVNVRSVSFHATSYTDSRDFLTRWADLLDVFAQVVGDAFVERAGLRYVDLIVPTADWSPADYVAPKLQGVVPEGATPTGSMWASAFRCADNLVVNLRVGAPSPQGMVLPPEFNVLPLKKPAVIEAAEQLVSQGKHIGFIDTDCQAQVAKVFNASDLMALYTDMQKRTSKTFSAVLSGVAEGEWR